MKAQKWSTRMVLPIHNIGARSQWVIKVTPRLLHPLESIPIPNVEEAVWVRWPVWTDVEKRKSLAPMGIRVPDRSAYKESQLWLRYPSPLYMSSLFVWYLFLYLLILLEIRKNKIYKLMWWLNKVLYNTMYYYDVVSYSSSDVSSDALQV
jgi:hypothetical protein